MIRPQLAILAKAPRIGQGKTRLAASVGRVQAWRMNRAMQAQVLRQVMRAPGADVMLLAAPRREVGVRLPGVWPQGLARRAQSQGDLGQRIADALQGPGPRAVIGADCVDIRAADIRAAFAGARRRGAAIGPARDGGFWILALADGRRAAAAVRGVRWSSAHACGDVLANLLGRAAVLRSLADVDEWADWRSLQQRRAHRRAEARRAWTGWGASCGA